MRPELRRFLESIGLRKEATDADGWKFYNDLQGDQRRQAISVRETGQLPTNPPTPPANPPEPGRTDPTPPANPPANPPEPGRSDPPPPANPPANPPTDAIRQAIADERERTAAIRRDGAAVHAPADVIERCINEGLTVERSGRVFLDHLRDRPAPVYTPGIHSRGHDDDCTLEAMQGAMLVRAGFALDDQRFARVSSPAVSESTGLPLWIGRAQIDGGFPDQAARDTAHRAMEMAHSFADCSLLDVCREAIRLDGGRVPASRSEQIRTAVSGGTLQNLFTTTVGAALLMSYEAAPDTTMGWVRERDVPNFQVQERVQVGKGSTLKRLPRNTQAEHTNASDSKESYRIARYARQFAVDEQDILDDAFNALLDMPMELGEAARMLRPDMVYALLFANAALDNDSVALFDTSTHGNLRTSAGLAADTLKTALTDMGIQTQGGRPLNLFGKYLIIPQTLLWTARQLTKSATLIGQGADAATVGSVNPLAEERLEIRADQRLDNGVTDPVSETVHAGATNDWFLAANGGRHTIEVGYLAGTGRSPQLRSFTLSEGRWGVGWDVHHNLGAKALDFRGLHKSEG